MNHTLATGERVPKRHLSVFSVAAFSTAAAGYLVVDSAAAAFATLNPTDIDSEDCFVPGVDVAGRRAKVVERKRGCAVKKDQLTWSMQRIVEHGCTVGSLSVSSVIKQDAFGKTCIIEITKSQLDESVEKKVDNG